MSWVLRKEAQAVVFTREDKKILFLLVHKRNGWRIPRERALGRGQHHARPRPRAREVQRVHVRRCEGRNSPQPECFP